MAAIKTIQFLPEVFRTDTNKKFLNATVDQLISEPNLKRVNGYIGRKLAPSYKNTDNYIEEPTIDRQNYQLEPSLIIKNTTTDQVEFASTYTDIINKIGYYGGLTDRHSRLFDNEYYSYDPKIDLDKFVNFSQYFWLENGPDTVTVSSTGVPLNYTFEVTYDSSTQTYRFTGYGDTPNPTLTLARGGIYKFVINEPDNRFFIQSDLGVTGKNPFTPSLDTRSVLGVGDNGQDVGTVSFTIPGEFAQLQWTSMAVAGNADYATQLSFQQVQGAKISDLNEILGGLDGIVSSWEDSKVIFVNNSYLDDIYWYDTTRIDDNNIIQFDQNNLVEFNDRNNIFKINVFLDQDGNERVHLLSLTTVDNEQKVRVRGGTVNAGKEFYSRLDVYNEVPLITAPLPLLYYQNEAVSGAAGGIQIIDPIAEELDPGLQIVGQPNFTSPSGIVFTNGMKVAFDATVVPEYQNKTFYVEGVGTAIRLVLVDDLICPELDNDLSTADYFTIKRSSLDQNGWSRSNRWFHLGVLEKTAEYNETDLVLDQNLRAQRPIIEFDADLQLFNAGSEYKRPIDILDDVITNVYTQLQGVICTGTTSQTFTVNGRSVTLTSGTRVVFSADVDNTVRDKIYDFTIEATTEDLPIVYRAYIQETDDTTVGANHTVLVNTGDNGSRQWYYNGNQWIESQQKTSVNQEPLFDVIDSNGISYGDLTSYPGSNFAGTKIISYQRGTGQNDSVLGIPLSYKNFASQGDIQFENRFDLDDFTYLIANGTTETIKLNTGLLQKNVTRTTSQRFNVWTINQNFTKQYQVYDFVYDGVTNLFPIDDLPDYSTTVPNIKVVINNTTLEITSFAVTRTINRLAILVDPDLLVANDVVFISIYSSLATSTGAHYEVPLNLDINSLNTNITSLTLGQIRNHLITFKNNSLDVIGSVPGKSNLRDIIYKNKGGSILQHSAPVIYSGLFLNHPTMNFIDSIKLATKEYTQFKVKFLELAANLDLDRTDISGSLDIIMSTINAVKNESFSWHYSDMIPHGEDERTILPTYTIFNPDIRSYEITTIFQDTVVSNKAVLVYLTRTLNGTTTKTLLVKGRDYYFDQTRAAIVFQPTFGLLFDDEISIVEYNNTDGSYVPETPTKLGLYPKFVPEIYLDNTYREPINVIQGHDGSIIPAFNDFRDDLLLELERRIYNNIKTTYDVTLFNINDYVPGKFRLTDYSRQEFNQILSQGFLTWVGSNRVDFTTNDTFKSSDPFTWNYKRFRDVVNGETLPGTWRSIYRYFYDTDRPHTNPWEMLGFSEKPDYWEDRYGPAPYTGGNSVLWSDLELGYIHSGSRAGIDTRYQRLNLSAFIPVDDSGNLRSPEEFLVVDFDSSKANTSYAVGDIGPPELAWRRSSEYPFALQQAIALAKPARYFALLMDVQRYYRSGVTSQFVTSTTNQHLVPSSVRVNGYSTTTGIERSAGYLNWIRDYIKNLGIADASAVIKDNLALLGVQLSYKVGGYTDKKFINLLAEQSSPSSINDSVVIPDENYRLELYKGSPINKITYSAVIVERSANGYTVSGYDLTKPYFFIIPSQPNNNAYVISIGKQRGVIYRDFKQAKYTIPYGFEFNTKQQVVDFLVGYQRYLQAQGFNFIDRDNDLNEQKDWILSAKEFLHWTEQGWGIGSILVMSPISNSITIFDSKAVVDEVKNTPYSSRVLDINYRAIKKNNFTISRENNIFTFKSVVDQTVGFAEFDLVQYEHLLILDNETVFRDIIYVPELGNRQYRLKLVGAKTADWTGSVELPGFIYSSNQIDAWTPGKDYLKGSITSHKSRYYTALENISASDQFQINKWKQISASELRSGMINNFATNAGQSANFYNVDIQPLNESLQLFSNGLIGFRDRSYFNNLGIDATTQSKFYQGLITQKGTVNSISALKGAVFNKLNTSITFAENWALRVGEYGAIDSNHITEIILADYDFRNNPAVFRFMDEPATDELDIVSYYKDDLYKSTNMYSADLFRLQGTGYPTPLKALPVAGFVNLDDVDATIFNLSEYATLTTIINQLGTGYKIWVARDFNNDWNVYRASPVTGLIFAIRYILDSTAEFISNENHGLAVGDLIALKNFDPRFDGVYLVSEIIDSTRFYVTMFQNLQELITIQAVLGSGMLFKLTTTRIEYPHLIDTVAPSTGWIYNDKVWVNNYDGNKNWGVYTKTDPWKYQTKVGLSEGQYIGKDHFGKSVSLDPNALFLYAGAPESYYGRVSIFNRNNNNGWNPYGFLNGNNPQLDSFGKVLANGGGYVAVGAPDSASGRGCVYIFNDLVLLQVLTASAGVANDQYGSTMAMSKDGRFLYIGAPAADSVYCYNLVTGRTEDVQIIDGDGSQDTFALTVTATDPTEIIVQAPRRNQEYIPGVDYTITGGNIVFTVIPANFEYISVTTRSSYYTLIGTIPVAGEIPIGNNIGVAVSCSDDGSTIAIGSNTRTVKSIDNAGVVYMYHRTVTEFLTDGSTGSFTVPDTIDDRHTVTYDGKELVSGVDYYIVDGKTVQFPRFANAPAAGKVLKVESNQFKFDQILYPVETGIIGAKFGSVIAMCSTGCNVYISSPEYREASYDRGLVTRYVNLGRVYGTVTGTIANPTVSVGDYLIINNRAVTFTTTTLDGVIESITAAAIPGVTATKQDNKLRIDSSVATVGAKLDIKSGTGSAIEDLGLEIYAYVQVMKHPESAGETFGSALAVDQTTGTLVVSSDGADISKTIIFDPDLPGGTTLDGESTTITELYKDTGAVYIFNLLQNPNDAPGDYSLFVYSQKLTGPELGDGFNFGAGVGLNGSHLIVGVSNDYDIVDEGGTLYTYYNENKDSGWTLSRYKEPRVEIGAVTSAFIYNRTSQAILDYFDYIDPAKGKLLGIVDQEIDYREDYDPASYNVSTRSTTNLNTSFYWTDRHIGRTWWDLTTVSFIDYEQGSLQYRAKNWGSVFPGSQVRIYEWIESDFLPSQYTGDGIPKYADDTSYSKVTLVDPATGVITQKYYYWVSGKTEVDTNVAKRTLSTTSLETYINSPKEQNIPYLGLLSPRSAGVYNVTDALVSDQVVLHLDTTIVDNANLLHNEWQLVQEGNGDAVIPVRIIDKIRDSLVGSDTYGFAIPSPMLRIAERIGIQARQSIFVNQTQALRTYITAVNAIFAKNPILLVTNASLMYAEDPLPTTGFDLKLSNVSEIDYLDKNLFPDGYTILVPTDSNYNGKWSIYNYNDLTDSFELKRLQGYKTPLLWTATDWYSSSYIDGKDIAHVVNIYSDIQAIAPITGEYIKVLDNGQGNWLLYEVQADTSLNLIAAQAATITLNTEIYDPTIGPGFDSVVYDSLAYDPQAEQELVNIFNSVYREILVSDLSIEFNNLFFIMVNYIFTEQPSPDWIFKTSFIDVYHQLRSLEQIPNYVKDDQSFYQDYINEVKPYRTQLKEYIPTYSKTDIATGTWSDFDLPSQFDTVTGKFKSPQLNEPDDAYLFAADEYQDWSNNYKYKVSGFILGNVGQSYTIAPNVEITGGGGTGATAITTINQATGKVTNVIVTSPGSGYTTTPTVFINGSGVGATAYPLLRNEYFSSNANLNYNTVRGITSTIRLDRFAYSSNVKLWEPNVAYANTVVVAGNTSSSAGNIWISSGNIIVYNNEAFLAVNANVSTESLFDFTRFQKIPSSNVLLNANDRISAYYMPESGMPGADPVQLMRGIEYPGINVYGPKFRANSLEITNDTISFNTLGLAITSGNIQQLDFVYAGFQIDQTVRIEAQVPFDFQNNGYFKIVSVSHDNMMLTGSPIETTRKLQLGGGVTITANTGDYITQANTTANGWVLNSVVNSTTVDVIFTTPDFQESDNKIAINGVATGANIITIGTGGNISTRISYLDLQDVLDSNIYSTYLDTALGTRPEDISITGGAYVDTYASHAPEELVPGRVYDTLEMRVFSNTAGNTATYGFRIFHPMSGNVELLRISDADTTRLAANLNITDTTIKVVDVTKLPEPNPASAVPGVIFINGERIHYYRKYDDAKLSTATMWAANTVFALDTLISYNGNVYLTLGNVYANANAYINSSNVELIVANSVGQIRRSVSGTGAPEVHTANSIVSDGSVSQQITANVYTTWLNMSGASTDGTGLEGSITNEALFIKSQPSYIP